MVSKSVAFTGPWLAAKPAATVDPYARNAC
jgi:hypothetical protein